MAIDEHALSARTGTINSRGFLPGTGASGSLVAAALVAFVSVAAFVAFDEVPLGGDGDGAGTISLGGSGSTAVSSGTGDVESPGAVALDPGPGARGEAGAAAPGAPRGAGGGDPDEPTAPPVEGVPPSGASPATAPTRAPNPFDRVVADLDGTVEGATGVNPNLAGAANPVTGAVDQAVLGLTGDDIGTHLDNGIASRP